MKRIALTILAAALIALVAVSGFVWWIERGEFENDD